MYQRAALHSTTANSTRYGGARRISVMCSPLGALRQTALHARGTLQRRPHADTCSRLAPPMLWTSSGQDTHAAGSVDCARLKSFTSRSVPSETKNVHSFAYGNWFNLDQVCTTNGHEFNAKICSIFVYRVWSQAAEKWTVFGRQNPYHMLARILYHNLGVCLVSKYKQ